MSRQAKIDICHRIAKLRLELAGPRGKASFAKQLGLAPSTYDYYESRRIPPADVLVKIADRTGVDLYWLLTGKAQPGPSPAADHPVVQRAAKLLAEKPDAAGPLAAFLEILAGVQAFPAAGPDKGRAPKQVAPVPVAVGGESTAPASGKDEGAREKESWVPILGRTAAGVPRFWAEGDDAAGVTMLAELVERHCGLAGRAVQAAAAVRPGSGQTETVQLITLPGAEGEATEFVAAESLKRRHHDAFALRVDGDSMAPEIRHGDIVILSPSAPAVDGRAAVVQLAGQIGVVCKLYRQVGNRVHLIPIHEQFAPQAHPAAKVAWALAVLARVRA